MGADEKLTTNMEIAYQAISSILDINRLKLAVVGTLVAFLKVYAHSYETRVIVLITMMWAIRFFIGTVEAVSKKEWTAAQCRGGLIEMGAICSATWCVYNVSTLNTNLSYLLTMWIAAWLTAEAAALAGKMLPYMNPHSPMTKLTAAMIRFFNRRVDNVTDLMNKLGKKKKENENGL